MANVSFETDMLQLGSKHILDYSDDLQNSCNNINSLTFDECKSLISFKDALNNKFTSFSEHSLLESSKLKECLDNLDNIEDLIGNNFGSESLELSEFEFSTTDLLNNEMSGIILNNLVYSSLDANMINLSLLSLGDASELFNTLPNTLLTVALNIEGGKNFYSDVNNDYNVKTVVNNYIQKITYKDNSGNINYDTSDLTRNDYYNSLLKEYGKINNIEITPNMLKYAGRDGYPLLRESIQDYDLKFKYVAGTETPTEKGEQYNFYNGGIVIGKDKKNTYSDDVCNFFESEYGSRDRRYSFYPNTPETRHMNVDQWYLCDDKMYRDKDGYIVCADQFNMGYNEDGSKRWVGQITSDNAIVVDTPFGLGKVYDSCAEGNIDIYMKY